MTATSTSNGPLRYLRKGSEYFRSTSFNSQSSEDKRMTATERLEADKLKYVKSAQARRRRATCDFQGFIPGRNTDSTGSHSTGSDSTVSPVGNPTGNVANSNNEEESRESSHEANNIQYSARSETKDGIRLRPRPTRRPRPKSSTTGAIMFETSFQAEPKLETNNVGSDCHANFTTDEKAKFYREKDKRSVHTLSRVNSYDVGQFETPNSSNYPCSKLVYHRSASLGAITPRQAVNPDTEPQATNQNSTMSPRSQLRHVRQNLKKVNPSKANDKRTFSYLRSCGKSGNSQAKHLEEPGLSNSMAYEHVRLRQRKSQRPRPFSVIENINHLEFNSNSSEENKRQTALKPASKHHHSKATSSELHDDAITIVRNETSSASKKSSQYLKRMSLDLSHTTNLKPSLHQQSLNPTQNIDTQCAADEVKISERTMPENKPIHDEEPINHRKPSQNRNNCGQNLAEALGKILIPSNFDSEMDTACCTDADSRTVLASPQQSNPENSFAAGINIALCGRTYDSGLGDSRKSESPDSQAFSLEDHTPKLHNTTSDKKTKFIPNFADGYSRNENVNLKTSTVPRDRQWVNDKSHRTTSQPFNRIDLAPDTTPVQLTPVQNSPMLAPRARKEIAPDYRTSGNTGPSNRAGKDDHLNTMKSQTFVSTTCGDNNKPLTALTASDLKPTRGKNSSATHSTPLKPTCPYSASSKTSPKRHNPIPLSPTMSPNKQIARSGPPLSARSSSSTPYSSLKRNPHATKSLSLKRNRQRSKSDVSTFQTELDQFFSTMGMNESLLSPYHTCDCIANHVSSESDFSFAGASAYVRDGPDDVMEVDPITARLASVPSVSVIEKNARVMKWIMSCKKSLPLSNAHSKSPTHVPSSPAVPHHSRLYNQENRCSYSNYAPIVPPRTYHTFIPKESNV